MLQQPNLDRFSQPGPMEKYPINVITIKPDCDVCGRQMDQQFLRKWNDCDVCRKCIDELEDEYERFGAGDAK